MAVIDGKYEILSQRTLNDDQLLYSATAPDGAALNLVWFELTTPEQEAQFEHYRQTLRQLKRQDLAALYDIVSRPGAHYVAWYTPADEPKQAASRDIARVLETTGYSERQAEVRLTKDGQKRVYALAFGAADEPVLPSASTSDGYPKPRRRRGRLPLWAARWGLGSFLCAAGLLLFFISFRLGVNDQLVTLPNVLGTNVNDAAARLHDIGLVVSGTATASEATPFEVLAMTPAPGGVLRPGQKVNLSYALPPEQVALTVVPQLRGQELTEDTRRLLEDADLRLGDVAYMPSSLTPNLILAQSRSPDTQVNEGSAIHLLVSAGPAQQMTFLPDLTGMSLSEAEAWARLAGVSLAEPDTRPDPRQLPDTVLDQSIPAYTPVPALGAVLRLTLAGEADGPTEAPLPSLIGLNRKDGERIANQAGFEVVFDTIENETESQNLPRGVVNQTLLGESNRLSLLINNPPVTIPVPDAAASVQPPTLRELEYRFEIEPGIGRVLARVTAETLEGEEIVSLGNVAGGEVLEGSWATRAFGPVIFRLYLPGDDTPYQVLKR